MKVPFLDLRTQYNEIQSEILEAVHSVLESGSYVLGEYVEQFEKRFAELHNAKHCLAVSSGTDANHLALAHLNLSREDEIIIPNNTFVATAWGAILAGGKPVFVECLEDTYNIDPKDVLRKITKKTKAIVAVHLYGQPAEMDELKRIAEENNIALIEDAAQAHLARYKGNSVGSFGIATSFSFYPGKNLGAYGEAGALITNSKEIYNDAFVRRNQGQAKKYYHSLVGHNYRMSALQGAILNVKSKYIKKWTEERRRVASSYKQMLNDIEQIVLPVELKENYHVYHLYVIRVESIEIRQNLINYLNSQGISTGLHYPVPLHLQECFSDLGYKKGDFPVSEKLADTILTLPIFPEMKSEQLEYVADNIKKFFRS